MFSWMTYYQGGIAREDVIIGPIHLQRMCSCGGTLGREFPGMYEARRSLGIQSNFRFNHVDDLTVVDSRVSIRTTP